MMKIRIGCLLLALLLLTGCAAVPEEMVNPVNFYLLTGDETDGLERTGTALTAQTVDLGNCDITINEILDRYLETASSGAEPLFPEGLEYEDLTLENGILSVNFNDVFATLSGVDLSLAAAALTLTLTQIDGVDGVSIRSSGTILSGDWKEVFTAADFLLTDTSAVHPEYPVQLYFLNAEQKLEPQRRMLSCSDRSQLPELAMEALLAGPAGSGLKRTIPEGTQMADISVDGASCIVVLSEEFAACDADAGSAQNAVHAVVLTLCSLDAVEQVQIQLLGGTGLKYCAIDVPLAPDPAWLE